MTVQGEQQSEESNPLRILTTLPITILTEKYNERKSLFEELRRVLANRSDKLSSEEQALKYVIKNLLSTVPRYHDRSSRNLVVKLLQTLAEKYESSPRVLVDVVSGYSSRLRTSTPTSNIAKINLVLLKWLNVLGSQAFASMNESSKSKLVQTVVDLVFSIAMAGDEVIRKKAEPKIRSLLRKIDFSVFANLLKNTSSDNVDVVVMWSFLYNILAGVQETDLIAATKDHSVNLYIKNVLGIKSKLDVPSLTCSSQYVLMQMNDKDFVENFLPAAQRAVLRNPEIAFEILAHSIGRVELDLSDYATELGKLIGVQLHSKEDDLREFAVLGAKNLAIKCSYENSVKTLIRYFFAILNGSEGKLTIVNQRYGVLSGIGALANHQISGQKGQDISLLACENFVTLFKSEVHEGTLVHAATQMQSWCSKLTTEVPGFLIGWYKTTSEMKTSTAGVKAACISCLNAALKEKMAVTGISDLLTILSASAQKSFTTSLTQMPVLIEGLYASLLIMRICSVDKQLEGKVKNAIAGITDFDKVPFLNEKFIKAASEDAQQALISLLDKIVVDQQSKLLGRQRSLETAFILLMTQPDSFVTRRQAKEVVKRYLKSSLEKQVTVNMNATFVEVFMNTSEDGEPGNRKIASSSIIDVLHVLSVADDDKKEVALAMLSSCHVPIVHQANSKIYLSILRKIFGDQQLNVFLRDNSEEIVNQVMGSKSKVMRRNALTTLVEYFPDYFMSLVINKSVSILRKPELLVTQEDYGIYRTPEGDLYDSFIVDQLRESSTKNIKRESGYSHKEQLAELQLKKEIEEKKKAKGEAEPQLNKKQLEMKKLQLGREAVTRDRVTKVYEDFSTALQTLYAAIEGNEVAASYEVSTIVPAIIGVLSSPLCADEAAKFFIDLSKCVFSLEPELRILGLTIGYVTLRQLKAACRLDEAWTREPLKEAVNRLISTVYKRTCRPLGGEYDEKSFHKAVEQRLTAPGFVYLFPLLSSIILAEKTKDELLIQCLQIVNEHSQIREVECLDISDDPNKVNLASLKNPQYLPRKEMLSVLLQLISLSPAHIEKQATKVLLEVALSASGQPGCATVTAAEVECLLESLKSESEVIRLASLEALMAVSDGLDQWTGQELEKKLIKRIFVANFDPEPKCSVAATNLAEKCGFEPNESLCSSIVEDIGQAEEPLRQSLAGAAEDLLNSYPDQSKRFVEQLIEIYHENCKELPAAVDIFGRKTAVTHVDTIKPRLGVALILSKIAAQFSDDSVERIARFLVPQALGDRNEAVHNQMLEAGIALVDIHGKKHITTLLDVFETFLDNAADSSASDEVRKSVVILMGNAARHLEKDDPKVKPIVVKLIESLSTPSQIVQEAVANCLPFLVPSFKDEAPTMVQKLLQLLLGSDSYGERKGAAYGIAGLVKGLGILSLKQLGIMATLTEAIQDKKNPIHREGALFAFEMLCNMLGRLFEPYIIHILPNLLLCFGDSNNRVRKATDDTAKAVMSKLSAHGVKLVLPSLLDALEEDSWRTKAGSIELLGAMAFCAPKQLSSCLPSIVPKLIAVLSDSHPKVLSSGAQALKQIGSVIRNPEIQAIVPMLLEALEDPANKTQKCLSVMLNTKFVHFIDAPSLALIMPCIERAFLERSTETRKTAAQIIGNMYSLTDQKDLAPYLPSVVPGLKASLLDPVPDVRTVTARALGAMVKGMGEAIFDDLMPWLMATLTTEGSSVDRSGAAQGLSEVIGGLGLRRLEKMMPEIIATAERNNIEPHVRDGYIMLFIYLPIVFTQDFTPFIGKILNPILKALADENEYVRDTALKAGQRVVNMYAETAIQLLLPQLERGLFDENWRIRYSSVQLLGDLLYKISGVSGKMTTETATEDDNFGTEQSYKAIVNTLGIERRNRVLSGLYMGRSDVSLSVRQAALHVWKVVVTNTPKTLKEILPTLFSLLLGCLASSSYDKQQVAARTLGDLVRKLGERVLPEIIPILEQGLESDRADQRQGVCIGLSEVVASTSREMVQQYANSLVPTITKALYDPLPEVRQAAAKTFDSLHSAVGSLALDEILTPLLNQLDDSDKGEATLDGLRQVMAIKSKIVLPYLVPQLTAVPVNTKALSVLSSVAGEALSKHLPKVLPALLQALAEAIDGPNEVKETEYCQAVITSVADELGERSIVEFLLKASKNTAPKERRASVMLLHAFCCRSKSSLTDYVPQLLRGLIFLFTDDDEHVLSLSWDALNAVTRSLEGKEQIEYVTDVRSAVEYAAIDYRNKAKQKNVELPGLCLPKGIAPILPVFREAILNGNPDQKEQASNGLAELIELTSPEALRSSVVNIAGPLIRILGDRYSWSVKVAVLDTLSLLLSKVGNLLRPFVPQLQQTFLKALSDSQRQVRVRAANAISKLLQVHTRCDPVFQEIHNLFKTVTDDSAVRETALYALQISIEAAGDKMSEPLRKTITATLIKLVKAPEEEVKLNASECLRALCKLYPDDEITTVVKGHLK
ncbi:eIF-2-alpha kinase activator GCN1 [Halotydeus destructor]|nr:eIF-2-alpha kinase activator GCN1 [Halotydeus destructor]